MADRLIVFVCGLLCILYVIHTVHTVCTVCTGMYDNYICTVCMCMHTLQYVSMYYTVCTVGVPDIGHLRVNCIRTTVYIRTYSTYHTYWKHNTYVLMSPTDLL
jgi:hypothetical protein